MKGDRLDQQAAAAADAAAQVLLGKAVQEAIAPVVDAALVSVGEIVKEFHTRGELCGVGIDKLNLSAFRELVNEVAFRLVHAVFQSHDGHRKVLYQIVGETCDRFASAIEWVTAPRCDPCGGSGQVSKKACEECGGQGRFIQQGDRVGIDVNVGFAEGAPGVPEVPPDGKLWTPGKGS